MTICVSIKVSEGLVLAADSTATIQGAFRPPDGQEVHGILKTYDNMRKLSHLKDYPIGTLTWGTALVGSRSVESLIKEYEHSLPSLEEEQEKLKEQRMRGNTDINRKSEYDLKEIANGLLIHLKSFYDTEFENRPEDQRPRLGILVSGYSAGAFFPRQWLINLPTSTELTEIRPNANDKPSFGANWFGLTDAIVRLHTGRDDAAIGILASHFQVTQDEVKQLLRSLEYPVFFDGMPLQDAIDYAVYLINVAIGRYRFVVGAPLCGGKIDVAVITPNNFTWVQRKSWNV